MNNSIINVVVNGMTAGEVIKDVQTRLVSVEKSVFNIALLCAYATGKTIPAYVDCEGNEHAEAICEKPMSRKDFMNEVGRAKSTISRWMTAFEHILDNNYFSIFAEGTLPFSYDKIILICDNKEVFEGRAISDLMDMTVKSLEALAPSKKGKKSTSKEEPVEETVEEPVEETVEDIPAEIEVAILTYDGKEYQVNKAIFEKWLSENAIVK